MRTCLLLLCAAASGILASCSSPREELQPIPPPVSTQPAKAPEPERLYRYEDRYLVRQAALASPTAVDDPLQAMRVIQLKEGSSDVLVVSAFEKTTVDGVEVATETWLGVELPSLAVGSYDLGRNGKLMFYRFVLGASGTRFEGTRFSGALVVESVADGYVTGSLDVTMQGVTKSFTAAPREEAQSFSGSFRIKEVPLEATIFRSK